jgi:hypothetical protein
MSAPRVFLAHPKGWPQERIVAAADLVRTDFGGDATVTTGFDDFQRNIASEGNFNGWARSVTRRTNQRGERVYSLIVVPGEAAVDTTVGKATAMIVADAVAAKIGVAFLDMDSTRFSRVTGLTVEDDDNYIAGWRLQLSDT